MSGKDLQGKIGKIGVFAKRLSEQASIASMDRQKAMEETQNFTAAKVISSSRSQDRGFNTIADNVISLGKSVNHHHEVTEMQRQEDKRQKECIIECLNDIVGLLKEHPSLRKGPVSNLEFLDQACPTENVQDFQRRSLPPDSMLALGDNRYQLNTLLGRLNVDKEADIASRDTVEQLRLIHILSRESQDRAVALIKSPQIHTWLTSTASSVLHVNGQMFFSEHEARQSPLSYTCAKFVDSVFTKVQHSTTTRTPTIILRWFCGQHTDFRIDYDVHPPGMLNNLLYQFIRQLLSLGIGSTSAHLPSLSNNPTLSELCELFVGLTQCSPPGSILFCILDGVSYYEDASRRDELTEVLLILKTLTNQGHEAAKGPLVKILTTAPLRFFLASRIFAINEVFDMTERYPPNGGFTALQWDAGIGGALNG